MGIYVSSSAEGSYKEVPTGTHRAVCRMLVDLGLQESTFSGETKVRPKIYMRFEVADERTEDGSKPLEVGITVGANLSKKGTLRPLLESWRGRPFTEAELQKFDVTAVLGKPCLISVLQETKGDKTYANIKSISPLLKNMEAPKLEGKLVKYSADDTGQWDDVPTWLQEKVKAAKQPAGKGAPAAEAAPAGGGPGGDVPFRQRSWKEG